MSRLSDARIIVVDAVPERLASVQASSRSAAVFSASFTRSSTFVAVCPT